MIIPCIDLMDGKVVQLVQGQKKALEAPLEEVLTRFAGFPQIQVIDLDAARDVGSNAAMVKYLAGRTKIRAGGGVRTLTRAKELIKAGAYRVIIGTAAFSKNGPNVGFLRALGKAIGTESVTIA